jgi:hypothetical protein
MIDCILFNDEVDLLISRIIYLSDFVERFVLMEARCTFSGKPKPLVAREFQSNLENISKKRIDYLEADFSQLHSSYAWDYEKASRSQLISYAESNYPRQRLLFCDLDEFPSREQLNNLKTAEVKEDMTVFSIPTPTYYRHINLANQDERSWRLACSFDSSFPPSLENIRSPFHLPITGEPGAHLSYLGMDSRSISSKLSSFSHTELQGFDEVETSILNLADKYLVDHLGRFQNPTFGLMQALSFHQLPATNMALYEIGRFKFQEFTAPRVVPRLCTSAFITFVRTSSQKRSILYKLAMARMSSRYTNM